MYGVKETLAMLEEAVVGNETYVYESFTVDHEGADGRVVKVVADGCYYSTPQGESSCLVGKVFKNNVPELFEQVRSMEEHNSWQESEGVYSVDNVHEYFTEDAIDLLIIAQSCQDDRGSWGKALENAKKYAEELEV